MGEPSKKVDISASRDRRIRRSVTVRAHSVTLRLKCFESAGDARLRDNGCQITYGESRTIDDSPDVWALLTLGLPW
jgi:hypothetical protein